MKNMETKTIARLTLLLRIITLLASVACMVVILVNTFHFFLFGFEFKITFKDFRTYKYVLAVAVTGAAYSLLQLPFAIFYVCTGKRLISRNQCLPEFDFYGDKVISSLLATGVGAGFATSLELKSSAKDYFRAIGELTRDPRLPDAKRSYDKFFDREIVATALLLLALLCMLLLSVFSSINRAKTSRSFFG